MTQDNLVEFKTPETEETFSDALSELLRQGARQIIAQAVEAELSEFLGQYRGLKDERGRQAVVRNGGWFNRRLHVQAHAYPMATPAVSDRVAIG